MMKTPLSIPIGIKILENTSLKALSTFKIGGKVRFLFLPNQISQLIQLFDYLDENHIRFILFGRASNILFADEMSTAYAVSTLSLTRSAVHSNIVEIQAGYPLRSFCYLCAQKNLAGVQGLSGIPGTIGGAIYMNAGAYGFEIADQLVDVNVYDLQKKKIITYDRDSCHFAYRKSRFMDHTQIILSARFQLEYANKETIMNEMKDFEMKRSQKQPLDYPSAGSVFKKPSSDFYPALEIDKLGLKGFCVGGACISSKHAGFIVNKGNATALDVKKLIEFIREKIAQKTGIQIETEIEFYQ